MPPNEIQLGKAEALTQEGKNNHEDRDGFSKWGAPRKWASPKRETHTAPEPSTNEMSLQWDVAGK